MLLIYYLLGFPLRKIIPYVYKIEGLKGFYKGYLPRIMKKSFSSGIFWSLYEKINNRSSPEWCVFIYILN